jgi:hypothetical protein
MSTYEAADYHRRIRQFADRRLHPDAGKAKRAQEHMDWWLDQYNSWRHAMSKAAGGG